MELDVTRALLSPGTEFPFEASEAVPPQDVNGETVTFDTVALRGRFSALEGDVRLYGELETTAHATCALCVQPARVPLTIPFDEMFRKGVNELEDEAFAYEDGKVPLARMTLTLVMLNLPMRFVCREGCEGSEAYRAFRKQHPEGSDREETPVRHPFEALQGLLDEEAGKAD